jgi:hypothetical protein
MTEKQISKSLGWLSIGLGATELAIPEKLGRFVGTGSRRSGVMRALGAREVLTGIGILARPERPLGLWARVAGDVMDAALLAGALGGSSRKRDRIIRAVSLVAAIGVLDYACAHMLRKRRGGVGETISDVAAAAEEAAATAMSAA